ncbi:peptidase inhibitor family I36 protein, partial [Nonomuraea sp. RK-328]|nr:peptidase inhibitor family I36 protein [Nonomuraea sp. RK-328]
LINPPSRRTGRWAVIAAAVVACNGLLVAPPAHSTSTNAPAVTARSAAECPADHVCVWERLIGISRRGSNYLYRDPFSSPQLNNFEDRNLYNVTGASNRTRFDIKLFTGPNGTGTSQCVNPGRAHAVHDSLITYYWKSVIIYTDDRACD